MMKHIEQVKLTGPIQWMEAQLANNPDMVHDAQALAEILTVIRTRYAEDNEVPPVA